MPITQREELFCILQDICEYVGNEKKKEYLGELEGKVKDFIQKHYSDNNLNVSMLGEEFNITSAYLSKIFKNHVGLSLH